MVRICERMPSTLRRGISHPARNIHLEGGEGVVMDLERREGKGDAWFFSGSCWVQRAVFFFPRVFSVINKIFIFSYSIFLLC